MRSSHDSKEDFQGLIADTMELPAVAPATAATDREPARKRWSPVLLVLLAIVGSFMLGLGVRLALNIPHIREQTELTDQDPTITSPTPVELGADLVHELGRKIEVPIFVEQVLPFIPQGDAHKYRVLGGYLLSSEGHADRTRPVMAVFLRKELEWGVRPKDTVLINGLVVMMNKTEQVAATLLSAEQEKDLAYISQRINYWDRITILGTFAKPYSVPKAE